MTGDPLPPVGTVTFLLTDIEGSTPLWEHYPAAMRLALIRHDALIAGAVQQHCGTLVKSRGEGDSTFSVFGSAGMAAAAALALQCALQAEPWPADAVLRVRIAIHTGEAEQRDGDYYGSTVNRVARLRALAHGGQIVLSQIAADLVRDALPLGATLQALGAYTLIGMRHPEQIFQLHHPALPVSFPALKGLLIGPARLPDPVTKLVGREAERARVLTLMQWTRLLTLVGIGGSGKTRLALQVASDQLAEYPHGVWLVELAALSEPALVPKAVAETLGLREESGRALVQTIIRFLGMHRCLLLLDNCEHLLGACATFAAELLRACPEVRILATSQEALGMAGETIWRVPPLTLPPKNGAPSADEITAFEAVQLFLARAAASQPGFMLTEQNASTVVKICRQLDGLPLAIELAAARLAVLPLDDLARRLDDRFRLLKGGNRTAMPRQQTLLATMEWSFGLLSPTEQLLLQRLAVFTGGWTLEAAESVCAGGRVVEGEVLDLLLTLQARSLVLLDDQDGLSRYGLLETVRQYALAQLQASGESTAVRRRHLFWYLKLAECANAARSQGDWQARWLDRLERENDNLRAALTWCIKDGDDPESALRLSAALWWFWSIRGHLAEGRQWLQVALDRSVVDVQGYQVSAQDPPDSAVLETGREVLSLRAAALVGACTLAQRLDDFPQAARLGEESLALWRLLDDLSGVADALACLGEVARQLGNYEQAVDRYEESLVLNRRLGNERGTARVLNGLGTVALYQAEYGRATDLYSQSVTLSRLRHDRRGVATAANNLGIAAQRLGNYEQAAALYQETLQIWRDLGDRRGVILVLINMGMLAHQQSREEEAATLFTEGLRLAFELRDRWPILLALEGLGEVAVASGTPTQAARLFGAAEFLRTAIGVPVPAAEQLEHARGLARVKQELGADIFAEFWAEGQRMLQEQAQHWALAISAALLQALRLHPASQNCTIPEEQ